MLTDYEKEMHDRDKCSGKKKQWGNGVHGNDPMIRMKWKSKSLWLLSIYHSLCGIGLNAQ